MVTKYGSSKRRVISRQLAHPSSATIKKAGDEYYDYLFRSVLRLTHDRSDAEEITQQAFVRFLTHMEKDGSKENVKDVHKYLMTIANNLYKDLWRRRKQAKPLSYDDDQIREALKREIIQVEDSVARIEDEIYHKELLKALPIKIIFRGLTEHERDLLYLRLVAGMSAKEVAENLGTDLSKTQHDLHKLIAKIRARVKSVLKEDEAANKLMLTWEQIHAKRDRIAS